MGAALVIVLGGCIPVQRPLTESAELLLIPASIGAQSGLGPSATGEARGPTTAPATASAVELLRMDVPQNGSWIAARMSSHPFQHTTRAGVLMFGGPARDPGAVLRVLQADTTGRDSAAAELRRAVAALSLRDLVVVPGALGPRDVEALFTSLSELAAGARAGGAAEILVAVTGADTAAYPSRLLATAADALLLSIDPAAPSSSPGPPVTVEVVRRTVGLRASEVGRGRLVLLLPAHGYLWQRDSLPRAISFVEGRQLAAKWRAPLLRDAASSALVARSTERGELWLADARLIARLVREARVMGVRRFAMAVGSGEDEAIGDSLAAALQTTSSSR